MSACSHGCNGYCEYNSTSLTSKCFCSDHPGISIEFGLRIFCLNGLDICREGYYLDTEDGSDQYKTCIGKYDFTLLKTISETHF